MFLNIRNLSEDSLLYKMLLVLRKQFKLLIRNQKGTTCSLIDTEGVYLRIFQYERGTRQKLIYSSRYSTELLMLII